MQYSQFKRMRAKKPKRRSRIAAKTTRVGKRGRGTRRVSGKKKMMTSRRT